MTQQQVGTPVDLAEVATLVVVLEILDMVLVPEEDLVMPNLL